MKDLLVYIIYIIFGNIIRLIPRYFVKYIIKYIAYIAYIVDTRHKKISYANLDLVYKDTLSNKSKKDIVVGAYINAVLNVYEHIVNQTKSLEDMEKSISLVNDKYIKQAIQNDKKIILVTAHYGSWELAIPYVSLKFRPISIISKPIKNKYLNKKFKKVRHKHNLEMFEKHGAAKKMVKALNNKRIVAMAIDQNISKSKGITLDFFGYKVTQTDSPIRVASKLDAIIIPMLFVRDGMFNHKAVFYEPMNIENNCTEDSIIKYSQQISNIFEKQIKEEPKDWFWQHRRFKEYYNKIYITN